MKTAGREKPNHYRQPSTWRGRSKQILLDQVGCEARKTPADGDVFFLDFSLYRTTRELVATDCRKWQWMGRGVGEENYVVSYRCRSTDTCLTSGSEMTLTP